MVVDCPLSVACFSCDCISTGSSDAVVVLQFQNVYGNAKSQSTGTMQRNFVMQVASAS